MKTLLIIIIITFYLISGPVHCSDLIGYPGEYLIIDFKHPINFTSPVYFCKIKTQTKCEDLIRAQGEQLLTGVHQDRFTLNVSKGLFKFIFKNLSLQDTGRYEGGQTGVWHQNINLAVNRGYSPTPITVCFGVLLMGGCVFICKKQDFGSKVQQTETRRDGRAEFRETADYENDQHQIQIGMPSYTNQLDSGYQSLDPNTNQINSFYHSLYPNTNQSDSVCPRPQHQPTTFNAPDPPLQHHQN